MVDCIKCENFKACHNRGELTGVLTSCPDFRQKPLTNAAHIRSMSDEELAKYHARNFGCPTDGECYRHSGSCVACWLNLLRQPYTQPHPGADDDHDHSGLLEE